MKNAEKDLRITFAKDDGVVGKDSVSVKDGNYTIQSDGNGIKSTNIEETDKGYILLENGTFQITSKGDAIRLKPCCGSMMEVLIL